jgi:hypothetical protein
MSMSGIQPIVLGTLIEAGMCLSPNYAFERPCGVSEGAARRARQRMPSAARLRHAQPLNASVMQQMIPRGTGDTSKAECRLSWEIL